MGRTALILLSGSEASDHDLSFDLVICADSGYIAAHECGIPVDYVVGDMDSIPNDYLSKARERGTKVITYPRDKDLTDGEIALRLALEIGCNDIRIAGGKHGRLDHILTTGLLPFLAPESVKVEVLIGYDRLHFLRGGSELNMEASGVVSIIPLSEDAVVSTSGLKWPLESELLPLGSTKGVHNEPVDGTFRIRCEKGSVWVVMTDEK